MLEMAGEDSASPDSSPSEACDVTEHLSRFTLERHLPRINCPEHIVLVVDVCREEGSTPYKFADGSTHSQLYMVKRALSLMLQNKHCIDQKHKYALIVLHDTPIWVYDFTHNPREILLALEELESSPVTGHCDLTTLFDIIRDQVTVPQVANPTVAPPPYIIRTVLVYGRSNWLPQFLNGKESFNALNTSPHFFLDILYTHETPTDDNKCEGIFDLLCGLDESGWSYVLEESRNATKLHNHCGALLAHPLQRPAQRDAHYAIWASSDDAVQISIN